MAKARNTTPVRDRALKAWRKAHDLPEDHAGRVAKSRTRKTVTVSTPRFGDLAMTWSYKGGSLRRLNA